MAPLDLLAAVAWAWRIGADDAGQCMDFGIEGKLPSLDILEIACLCASQLDHAMLGGAVSHVGQRELLIKCREVIGHKRRR